MRNSSQHRQRAVGIVVLACGGAWWRYARSVFCDRLTALSCRFTAKWRMRHKIPCHRNSSENTCNNTSTHLAAREQARRESSLCELMHLRSLFVAIPAFISHALAKILPQYRPVGSAIKSCCVYSCEISRRTTQAAVSACSQTSTHAHPSCSIVPSSAVLPASFSAHTSQMVVLLATGGYDQTIRFWDASSGMCYRTLSHPDKAVNCLQIRPDKAYIAAGGNPHIKIYEVNGKGTEPLVTYEGHTSSVTAIGFQRDGRWMWSSSEDGTIKIWDLRTPSFQRNYECGAPVTSVALHPNQGELVSGDQAGNIRVWDLTANKCCNEFAPEADTPISSVSVAADASLCVAANYNGSCYFWAPRSSEEYTPVKKLQAHKAHILAARCVI